MPTSYSTMSRSIGSSRSVLRSLLQGQQQQPRSRQQCNRFLSTRPSSSPSPSPLSHRNNISPLAPSITAGSDGGGGGGPRIHPRYQQPSYRHEQRRYKAKTVEEARSRYRTGPFSWKAGLLFVATSAGLVWYFEHEKQRMHRRRVAEATKGVGRPKVGGAFELVDQEGRPFSSADLRGRYSLVSEVFFLPRTPHPPQPSFPHPDHLLGF